jgi:hypothetical protein
MNKIQHVRQHFLRESPDSSFSFSRTSVNDDDVTLEVLVIVASRSRRLFFVIGSDTLTESDARLRSCLAYGLGIWGR